MAASNEELTQAEIWDDSALLKSWDEAVKEYKKYHSLAAKGEKVPVSSITAGVTANEPATNTTTAGKWSTSSTQSLNAKQQRRNDMLVTNVPSGNDEEGFPAETSTAPRSKSTVSAAAAIPDHLMQTVQNEDLKNLMMSWYYAGYYTGLYEGKQQAIAAVAQQGE